MTNWIAVASADHVRFGRSAGFMQVSHGAGAPLRRIRPGDRVAYYSPTTAFKGKDRLQSFIAIGIVAEGEPYRAEMGNGFRPYRRDVRWLGSGEAPIRPLLERLDFARGGTPWGHRLRRGLLAVSDHDMAAIAAAMGAALPTAPAQRAASADLNRSTAKSTNARSRALARRPAMWTTWTGSGGSS